jgi:hypothetical protein
MVAIVRIGIGHDPPHAAGLAAVAITRRMMPGLAGLFDGNRLDEIGAKLRLAHVCPIATIEQRKVPDFP